LAHTLSEILKEYGSRISSLEERLEIYYKRVFEKIPLIDLLSKIKLSISIFYSRRLKQELPSGSSFALFPHFIMKWIKNRTSVTRLRRSPRLGCYRLCHSILQCKSVLPGPARCHIEKIYIKHAETLSKTPLPTPDFILKAAYERGQDIGRIVSKKYNPYNTVPPSRSATFDKKRDQGGQFGQLNKTVLSDYSAFRVEPTVLFLSGVPGVGKSRLVLSIVKHLSSELKLDLKKSVFVRNCNVTHWDGYQGQQIVVLDDWGQEINKSTDLVELISLVTDNCYPLPMADLKEKGKVFTSQYIILCSNINPFLSGQLSCPMALNTVRDKRALIRRMHIPVFVGNALSDTVSYIDISTEVRWMCESSENQLQDFHIKPNQRPVHRTVLREEFIENYVKKMIEGNRRRQHGLLSEIPELSNDYPWTQQIYDINQNINLGDQVHKLDYVKYLYFPLYPPSELPQVRTVAVAKALGSRMVTCAEANVRVLKPFQQALWESLDSFKQFKPTHGLNLQSCYDLLGEIKDDEMILSGDYESATDNLHMDFSNAILEGILSQISHEPTKAWARYENGKHILNYPAWTQIQPLEQSNGQLMGSLLSFPLLCIANDVLTSLAGIKRKIINGDDLLCFATEGQYRNWTTFGKLCGLEPSIGKNFRSKVFGTFNSQLFVNGKFIPYTNSKLVQREYQKLQFEDCIRFAIDSGVSKRMIVRNNHKLFLKTPRSIDIPSTHGGLGVDFDRVPTENDRLCYLYDLHLKKTKSQLPIETLPKGYVWFTYPKFGSEKQTLHLFKDESDTKVYIKKCTSVPMGELMSLLNKFKKTDFTCKPLIKKDDILLNKIQTLQSMTKDQSILKQRYLSKRDIVKLKKTLIQNQGLRDFIHSGNLQKCKPIGDIQWVTIPCKKSDMTRCGQNLLEEFIIDNERK
jgi:hypothetical protein